MPPNPDQVGDVAAALAYADDHGLIDTIDLGHDRVLVRQRDDETWKQHDTHDPKEPRRSRGTVAVHDGPSFVQAVGQRDAAGIVVVYADEESLALTAVLNDDAGGQPGWRDYRVTLALRPTEEWKAWKGGQGPGDQERFARRIEDGMPEIVNPAGAVMLELAQTFHATVGTTIKSGHRIADGQTQLVYEEDVKASAGSTPGTITIPDTFTLGVAPFLGSDPYRVVARLRYDVPRRGGDFKIGYQLVRPEAVERDAFTAVVALAREAMEAVPFINGPAPSPAA